MNFYKESFVLVLISILYSIGLGAQELGITNRPYKAYVVSNAHFDSQWNWDVQKSIEEYIPKTINQNLFLLGKYPNYIINFEGGVKYAWMKEYFPDQYELIKKYIENGRWHISGSTWDATDMNIPSPESLTRNILYGQHFYRNEFGILSTDIFLPDCFGFSWIVPTIASHSGLIGFSTQKLQWREKPFYGKSKVPFDFGLWQGVDGTRIMAVANAHNYVTSFRSEDLSNNTDLISLAEGNPLKTIYHYYGTGDTGGAPTIESVQAVEKGVKGNGPLQIISATSDQLFKDYIPFEKHSELPVFDGELLMDVHGTGCYTSQAAMKLYNRRNEILGDASERAAVIADWLGAVKYPKEMLTEAWKRFVWHQFHDDLTGTSIPRAYEFSWNDELISMKQFVNVLTTSVGGSSRGLDTQVRGIPLVIYNPISTAVNDIIEIEVVMKKLSKLAVYDEKGKEVPSQLLSYDNGKARLLVVASAPSVGYVVYDIRESSSRLSSENLKVSDNSLENSIYKVTLNTNGDIESIIDKRFNNELVENGKSIRLALFTQNESFAWPAWEIMKKDIDKEAISITEDVKISIIENGNIRIALCVERKYGESVFKQYIRLTNGGQDDRIDIYNEIDWNTSNALLKAEFPMSVSNSKATYDLGIGTIERGNNTDISYETYSQYWADLTDNKGANYGVSIMNDCKYGWDKPNDNTLRLTLLHTPKTNGRYAYQDKQDLGHHQFTYSILGHSGSFKDASTPLKAEILNQPLKAFVTEKQKGKLGKKFSFVEIDNENIIVKALKLAENSSDEYIIRMYDMAGNGNQYVNVKFATDIISAKEVNGIEDEIGEATFVGSELSLSIPMYSLKSYKVKLKSPEQKLSLPTSEALTLNFNHKATSYNSFRNTANFDKKGNSFAAEIWPTKLSSSGIDFQLQAADVPNSIQCSGDTLYIPQNKGYNKLYLLMTSIQNDRKASFKVENELLEAVIPSYTGYIGQWGQNGYTKGYLKSADVAYVGTHRHSALHNRDLPYEFTYMFNIGLDISEKTKYVILPSDKSIIFFAATVVNDRNNNIYSATDLLNLGLDEPDENSSINLTRPNILQYKKTLQTSGFVKGEEPESANDDNLETKWCDTSSIYPKYVAFDLEKEESITGWSILHAGLENLNYITKEYALQIKSNINDEWKTIDLVKNNRSNETDRVINGTYKARFVRLLITKPDQDEGSICRIYNFSLY